MYMKSKCDPKEQYPTLHQKTYVFGGWRKQQKLGSAGVFKKDVKKKGIYKLSLVHVSEGEIGLSNGGGIQRIFGRLHRKNKS